jgi:predicted RNA-binding protein YlxR (DUF448 family)
VGCGRIAPKAALLRLATVRPDRDPRSADARGAAPDIVVADPDARLPGRGAYVCDARCAEAALRRRALPRAFRRPVMTPPDFVESIG